MSRADILKKIADHNFALAELFSELADAAIEQSAAGAVPASAPADDLPEMSPFESDTAPREAVLGECPVHFKAWTVKEGGISRNGRPYKAFWKCTGKNSDGSYCDKKPLPAWVKTHDPERALLGAA